MLVAFCTSVNMTTIFLFRYFLDGDFAAILAKLLKTIVPYDSSHNEPLNIE